ncbi:hypothetical protein niasHT_032253 [Heterodera trifolii]|uniref:Peptidase S1 domain-containing protein n=1 Tax=Heterodera trifolii TaxID=157864 RepID=A0ABD2I2V1_9BILA
MESSYAKIITNDGEPILSKFGKEFESQIANGAFLEEYGGFWLMGVAILRKIGQKGTKIRVNTSENCELNVISKYEQPKCHTFNGRKRFGRHINPLIHGGHKVNIKHVPWNVRFIGEVKHKNGRTTKVLCSGTLISSEYVLLAAHCVQNVTEGQTFHIGYNSSSADDMFNNANGALSTAHQRRNNFNVFIHPSYRPDPQRIGHAQYDQAIIKLNCVLSGPIYPVCIHCGNANDFRAGKAFVSGWGQEEDDCKEKGHGATMLMGRFVQLTECHSAFRHSNNICIKGAAAQKGDSGGALLANNGTHFVQVGVLSAGLCDWWAKRGHSSIYSLLDGAWIEEITGLKCSDG